MCIFQMKNLPLMLLWIGTMILCCFSCADFTEELTDGDEPIYHHPDSEDGDLENADSNDSQAESETLEDAAEEEYPDVDGDRVDDDFDAREEDRVDLSEDELEQPLDGDDDSQGLYECLSFNDCPGDDICDLSLGRCERRKSLSTFEVELYSFHPPQAAPGDLLVIDGNGFLGSNLFPGGYSVMVGSDILGGMLAGIAADENRLLVPVSSELSGKIMVSVSGFNSNPSSEALRVAPSGLIDCEADTPAATYENGSELGDAGPYAAAYLDFLEDGMRVFYPAECGSIRRQAVTGEFPLVIILHGNGALHIGYEYIAQLLATWGFISLMPGSVSENDSPPEVAELIYDRISPFIEADLGDLHPVLEGLSTSYEIAMIGHSRGCARMQNVYRLHPDLLERGVASVWLGPAQDADLPVPGFFLLMGAELDGQSFKLTNFDPAWQDSNPPRCQVFIWGGNHSLFGDHKVYSMFDGIPTIARRQQLGIVNSYVLPVMQRAFGHEEHWPEQLDNATGSTIHQVICEME